MRAASESRAGKLTLPLALPRGVIDAGEFLEPFDYGVELLRHDGGRDQLRDDLHRLVAAFVGFDIGDGIMSALERLDQGLARVVRRR